MTKTEIIKKNLGECYEIHDVRDWDNLIENAMDDWGKEVAIGFNKWYRPFKLSQLEKCTGDKTEWLKWSSLPDEEYFSLYLTHLQKH